MVLPLLFQHVFDYNIYLNINLNYFFKVLRPVRFDLLTLSYFCDHTQKDENDKDTPF